ncbi:addiction module protein [Deferrisoma camini]|uniref:addiction module protein n=1 Tax=Deferrisoma camini TaxID=1035120 RepID=UPI00046D5FA5|nr:addiction module protein [Deferrisoma camini]
MQSAKKITAADALALDIPERIRLVGDIWDSIAEVPEAVPVTDEIRAELDRRLRAYEDATEAGEPWSVVRERLLHRK